MKRILNLNQNYIIYNFIQLLKWNMNNILVQKKYLKLNILRNCNYKNKLKNINLKLWVLKYNIVLKILNKYFIVNNLKNLIIKNNNKLFKI